LGLDIEIEEKILKYCKFAKKIILEYATCFKPSEKKFNDILEFTKKQIEYDFIMNFSNIPVFVDKIKCFPARYNRRIVVLE